MRAMVIVLAIALAGCADPPQPQQEPSETLEEGEWWPELRELVVVDGGVTTPTTIPFSVNATTPIVNITWEVHGVVIAAMPGVFATVNVVSDWCTDAPAYGGSLPGFPRVRGDCDDRGAGEHHFDLVIEVPMHSWNLRMVGYEMTWYDD